MPYKKAFVLLHCTYSRGFFENILFVVLFRCKVWNPCLVPVWFAEIFHDFKKCLFKRWNTRLAYSIFNFARPASKTVCSNINAEGENQIMLSNHRRQTYKEFFFSSIRFFVIGGLFHISEVDLIIARKRKNSSFHTSHGAVF